MTAKHLLYIVAILGIFWNHKVLAQCSANAGIDVEVCGLTATLSGNSTTGTGTWSGDASFANIHNPTTTVSVSEYGIYAFTWMVQQGTCVSTDQVVLTFSPPPSPANAGADATICGLSYQLSALAPAIGIGTWSGPGIFSDPANPQSTVTVSGYGSYTFYWTTSNCNCPISQDGVTIAFSDGSPYAYAGQDQSVCSLSTGLQANLPASGIGVWSSNQAGVVFSNPNSNNTSVSVPQAGNYTFTWTVNNSCGSASDNVAVSFGGGIAVNAWGDATICVGGSAQINASGGTNYSWSPTTGLSNPYIANPIASPSVTTTYIVTVTNGNGCSDTDQVVVQVGNNLSVNAGSDVNVCGTSTVQLNATGGGSTYSWSPSTGLSNPNIANPTATVSQTTTYTVTSTNGSCTASDQVTIFVGNGTSAYAGADAETCGLSYQLNANPVTGGSGTWSSNDGATFSNVNDPHATVTVPAFGIYSFTWTTTGGTCTGSSDNVIIHFGDNPSPAYAGPDATTNCGVLSYQLNATPIQIGFGTWVGDNGVIFSDIYNPNATVTVPSSGTYTFTWASANCSCPVSSDQVTITFPSAPQANAGADVSMCSGGSVQLNASGGSSYVWSPSTGLSNANVSNPMASPSSTTTYTVTVSNGNGCTSTDQVTVTVNSAPQANAWPDPTICAGESVQINASGGGNYSWSPSTSLSNPNIANPIASPSATTVYTVTVSNDCGTSTDIVTVTVLPTTQADAGASGVSCGYNYTLNANGEMGAGTWTSNPPNATFSNIHDPHASVTVGSFGYYTFTWTLTGTCNNSSDSVIIEFGDYPSTAQAGTDNSVCGLSYTMNAVTPQNGMGTWIGSGSFSNINDPHATVTVPAPGTYAFIWLTSNCSCPPSTDVVYITFGQGNSVNAGNDVTICAGESTQLSASGGNISYSWSPATGLSNANIPNPVASPTTTTIYTVTSTSSDGCVSSDQVTVYVNPNVNVNAGQDDMVCGLSYQLSGSPSANGTWTASPSNGVVFSNANGANTTVTVPTAGSYTFTYSVQSNCGIGSDNVNIQFYQASALADAGPNATVTGTLTYQLNATGNGTWSGPGTFANVNDPNTTVTVSSYGTYTFVWTVAGNGPCSGSQDAVTITFNEPTCQAEGGSVTTASPTTVCVDNGSSNISVNVSGANSGLYTYVMLDGNNNILAISNSGNFTIENIGTYYIW
ncbi:MAG: hypothetical protein KDD49_11610, partial [Bacteroidetes bacterium]|nr:hypothetical protein [Bacteroidota bacterium]